MFSFLREKCFRFIEKMPKFFTICKNHEFKEAIQYAEARTA